MKKIILVCALLLIGVSASKAQKANPTSDIASKFNEQFKDATNVQWSKMNSISVARFNFGKSFRIAYYDQAGELIAKGRKIPEAQLPMNVFEDLQVIKSDLENKSGKVAMGGVYEFLRQSGETEYVTSLETDQYSVTLATNGGKLGLQKKTKKHTISEPQDLIAKAPH